MQVLRGRSKLATFTGNYDNNDLVRSQVYRIFVCSMFAVMQRVAPVRQRQLTLVD